MKKITLSIALLYGMYGNAQTQIGNGNMEAWENVGQSTEEPINWNSFKTGTGSLSSFASKQIQQSTNIRSGASGTYCARIYSVSILGAVANGNMTLGQINMGSSTPTSASNYNFSKIADANFSEAITDHPDSIVFWVKFTPASGSPNARMHAILHDSYEFRDPIDANSLPHVVARAELNYPSTNGQWVRKSVPFVNEGPASNVQYLLVSFATNQTPGGGAANDEVLIDDVQLIYNQGAGVEEVKKDAFYAGYTNGLHISSADEHFEVIQMNGTVVYSGAPSDLNGRTLHSGLYIIKGNSGALKILVP